MRQELSQWLWIIAGIIFFVIYFGYGPYERHRLRLKRARYPMTWMKLCEACRKHGG